MRRLATAALAAAATGIAAFPAAATTDTPAPALARLTTATTSATPGFRSGEILVSVATGVDVAALARAAAGRDTGPIAGRPDVRVLVIPAGTEVAAAGRALQAPGVRWATPNHLFQATAVPNDPGFVTQWNLAGRSTSPHSANWEAVYGGGLTGTGIRVAVIDTGVTANADLDGVAVGYDFIDNDIDASDPVGHGTHVAGTIAQSTGNGQGVAGVAHQATIIPIRALDDAGLGTTSQLLSALAFARTNGAHVVNMSLSGDAGTALCAAVAEARDAGITVVAAAGNKAGPVGYPAACPAAIAVSATTIGGSLAPYSNRGIEVDIAAPGGDTSTDANGDGYADGILQYSVFDGDGGYYIMAGTSMAAPHVAAAAAILRQANPAATPTVIRAALLGSASDRGPAGADPSFGAGLLDIAAAAAAVGHTPAPVQPPPPGPAASEPPPATTKPTPDTGTTETLGATRIAGDNRYATAAAAAQSGWAGGATTVYLASGRTFTDGLATGALAGRAPGPVLLAEPCQLPPATATELGRLSPSSLVIVGGTAAVCDAVVDQAARASGARAVRVAGGDRYATAAALAGRGWPTGAREVLLATGESFADGLAGAARAAAADAPLLLTGSCALPTATARELARLGPGRVTILGGTAAVCDAVLAAVRVAVPGASVRRLAGSDRYDTSAVIAADGWPDRAPVVLAASGATFPDALAAGPLAALREAPILLVAPCDVPLSIRLRLVVLRPSRIGVLGGNAVVCDRVVTELDVYAIPA